jgi:hypothetical protein
LRSRTSLAGALLLASIAALPAKAVTPSVAALDAAARASGNRRDIATRIGDVVFRTQWPAEVNQISANAVGRHLIVGVRMWGVKFHHPLSKEAFVDEVVAVVDRAFAAAPQAEEVDLWTSVPLSIGKGAVVSGDLARPTSRTVFALTVMRGESAASLRERALSGNNVFWDAQWMQTALANAELKP